MDQSQVLIDIEAQLKQASELAELRTACVRKAQEALSEALSLADPGIALRMAADGIDHVKRLGEERLLLLHQAIALCDTLLGRLPDQPKVLHLKGMAVAESGQVEAGLALLRQAVEKGPEQIVLHLGLGQMLVRLGRIAEAAEVLDSLLLRHPMVLAAHDIRYALYNMLNQPEKARAAHLAREDCAANLRCDVQDGERWEIVTAAAFARMTAIRRHEQICIVSERPRAREQKIGQALLRAGKEVILLQRYDVQFDLSQSFSRIIRYSEPWQALNIATTLPSYVFHVASLAADETSILFVRHKPGPVIFDANDIFPGMSVIGMPAHVLDWQTEALREADGLCCRDLQYRAAEKKNKWEKHKKVIWFPEYIDKICAEKPSEDDVVRAVSAGNAHTGAGGSANGAELFLRPFVKQGMRVDIFPHFFFWNRSKEDVARAHSDMVAVGMPEGRITVRQWVPPGQLVNELAPYDVGLLCSGHYLLNGSKDYSAESLAACGSSRETDYLAAGLLIIGDPTIRLIRFIARRYGEWMDVDAALVARIDEIRAGVARAKARTKAWSGYTMDRNIGRLVSFYDVVVASVRGDSSPSAE